MLAVATPAGQRPTIGLVAPLPPQVGGVASVAEWLLAHQDEIGCRYEPFDLWRPPDDEAGGRLRLASLGVQTRVLVRFLRWLHRAPRVVHYCVACTPTGLARDLVFLALLRARGRTAIAHVHGSRLIAAPRSRALALGLRLVARLSAERVAIAPGPATVLESLGVRARWVFNPIRIEPTRMVARADSPTLRLLFVGTHGERKGCLELVEALARIRAEGVDAVLRMVGKEEHRGEEAALRAKVAELGVGGAVRFSGALGPEELAGEYEQADVLCLPSHKEGLPMVLLEAMAFGLPVVSTLVGGIPDVVEDAVNGYLVEPGDVDALAARLRRLAEEPALRRSMGEAGRRRVSELAGPRRVAAAWRRLYAPHVA